MNAPKINCLDIEIAYNHHEAAEYAKWLNRHGHNATIGDDTGTYINGVEVSDNVEVSAQSEALWTAYCNEATQ